MSKGTSMGDAIRAYCEERGLDPQRISGTMRQGANGWTVTSHVDVAQLPGFAVSRCCCGKEDCDGGLAERLEAWGVDPAEVTEYHGTIPLEEA